MVKINNQRKAFLLEYAWRGQRTDVDVRKPEIMNYDVIVGGSYFFGYSITSQTCHAKPKTQINRRGRYRLLSRWWDAYRKAAWPERLLSEKLRRCGMQQIKERGALPMIDRGDIRQAIDRCSNIWASLPGAGYGRTSSIELTADCKIQRSGRNSREIDV